MARLPSRTRVTDASSNGSPSRQEMPQPWGWFTLCEKNSRR